MNGKRELIRERFSSSLLSQRRHIALWEVVPLKTRGSAHWNFNGRLTASSGKTAEIQW
jgi:hypothetical protein